MKYNINICYSYQMKKSKKRKKRRIKSKFYQMSKINIQDYKLKTLKMKLKKNTLIMFNMDYI